MKTISVWQSSARSCNVQLTWGRGGRYGGRLEAGSCKQNRWPNLTMESSRYRVFTILGSLVYEYSALQHCFQQTTKQENAGINNWVGVGSENVQLLFFVSIFVYFLVFSYKRFIPFEIKSSAVLFYSWMN